MRNYAERRVMRSSRRQSCRRRGYWPGSLHIIIGSTDAFQHRQEPVWRMEAARLEHRRRRRSEGFELPSWVRSQVISVLWRLACPSQRETFRTSRVAWSVCIAQVCRRTWGVTRLLPMDGCVRAAVAACLARMYSKPERVMARPTALRNNAGSPLGGRRASQIFNAVVVSFHNGSTRSRRPFPSTWMLDSVGRSSWSNWRPTNSDTRSPAAKAR